MVSEGVNVWLHVVDLVTELSDDSWSPPKSELVVISFGVRTSNNGVGVVSNQPLAQQSSGGKSSLGDSRVSGFFVPIVNVTGNASSSWVGDVSSSSEGNSLVVQSSNEVVASGGAVVGEDEEVIISGGGNGESPAGVTNIVSRAGARGITG